MKRNSKRLLSLALALVLGAGLAIPALGAGLKPIRSFEDSGLTDVPEDWSWIYIST